MTTLRYPEATFVGCYAGNHGGPLDAKNVQFVVAHIAQGGSLVGLTSWFHNPEAQVSSHFGIGLDGSVVQFVELDTIAWAQAAYNDAAISIEHVGFTGNQLTGPQLAASLKLIRWLCHEFDVPASRTLTPSRKGVIGHGELGELGGGHPRCPGTPILRQLDRVLGVNGVPPVKETKKMITFSPAFKKLVNDFATFVRTGGSWAVVLNDVTKTFHISNTNGINTNAVLTAVAGAILFVDHKKAKSV